MMTRIIALTFTLALASQVHAGGPARSTAPRAATVHRAPPRKASLADLSRSVQAQARRPLTAAVFC
jgi:hypothetical protein